MALLRAFATPPHFGLMDEYEVRATGVLIGYFAGIIVGAIVDHNALDVAIGLSKYRIDGLCQKAAMIVARYDDRN